MSMTPAMESIFANAQQNAASLIETAALAINAKVNTIEEAEEMIQSLSTEAVMFNELLTTIMNAMRQVESGDMQKEEAAGIITPAVKELKDKCTALKISNAEAPGDDITEDEIAILRELIIGAKAAAEDRLVAIRLGDDDKVDPEVEAEVNTPDEDAAEEGLTDAEVATEAAFLAAKYVNTNDTKTAKALYSNAKKLYSLGSKDKALQYMKQAKKLYEKALAALLKSGKFTNVERTESYKIFVTVGTRKNMTKANSMSFAIARSSLEAKIDRCQAHILQWTTKAGKETYQQTLDQLKADREQAKAAKKAAKATENYESEGLNMILTDNYDQMLDAAALEAMDYEVAIEGTNMDQHKMKKAYSKEVRSLAKEAKKCYRAGKYAEAKNMYMKCVDLCKQFITDIKAIPQDAKDIQFGSWMYALRTMFIASDSPTETIDRQIELLNKQGNGELTHADFNKYTQSLISEASALVKKYQKLADKAAKGDLDSKATESEEFNYDDFMFACESLMDELEMDVVIESEGADENAAPSGIGTKLRSAMSKFKKAFKCGDKKAAEEAKKEVDAAADELAAADDGSEEKKKGLSKQAKIGIAAAATVAVTASMIAVGKSLKNKAEGSADVSGKGAASAIKSTISKAYNDMMDNADLSSVVRKENKAARKEAREQKRQERADRALINQIEAHKAKRIAEDNKAARQYNQQKQKQARANAKVINEAFGISEFDVYEVLLEAMNSISEEPETEADLVSAIEAMI